LNAVWTTAAPSDLSTVRRVAFNAGATLAAGACITPIDMAGTITTTNATLDIYEIGDVFATNSNGATITDQSGDTVANAGDGNANFDEGNQPGNLDGNGIQQVTTLVRAGSILIGPLNNPAATGPTGSTNDDFTNRSVSVPGIPAGGVTVAANSLVFTNSCTTPATPTTRSLSACKARPPDLRSKSVSTTAQLIRSLRQTR
jgi:hypothetical protein